MADLNDRLRGIDRLSPPDLWEVARAKAEAGAAISTDLSGWRRAAIIAASLSIGLAAVAWFVVAVRPTNSPLSPPPGAIFFPTTESGPTGMEALYRGSLIERDGCVFMGGGDQVSLPLWPEGYSVDREASGALQIHAEDGSIVAVVGERMSMGGGYIAEFFPPDKVGPRDAQIASVEESLGEAIPPRCLGPDVYGIWLVGSIDAPDPTATPTTSPEPVEQFFVPPTTTQGSTTTLPLVFPDGSRADLTYPADLLLAERGIAPNLLVHLDGGDRCGWDGIIGYDTLQDVVYEGEGPTFSVDGELSHVEIWEGAKGYLPQYLVIRKGSWEVTAPCPRSPQIEDEATAWADNLKLTTTPEGYLVVEVTPPLVIEGPEAGASFSGPELYFLGGEPSVDGATGILSIGVATRCPEGEGFKREPGWALGCFQTDGGAVIMTIQTEGNRPAERAYLDAVADGVEVTDVVLSGV